MTEPHDHLTEREVAQLSLDPTCEAVRTYLETSESTEAHFTELGIDIAEMVVRVSWVGGVLDPATDAAFAEITAETGFGIKIIPTRFSREDLFAAMDEIFRSQEGVLVMEGVGDSIDVGIAPEASLAGRPDEVRLPGKQITIPVTYRHSDAELLGTGDPGPG